MDNVHEICYKIATELKTKYDLNYAQQQVFDTAISRYDYQQNEAVLFTTQFAIFTLFTQNDTLSFDEEEMCQTTHLAPTTDCIFAVCEYIVKTIQYYDLWKSKADDRAKEILQYSAIYNSKEVE